VTQALLTLDLAREAGVQRIVYFSVFNSALFDDVPHFASKHLAERVIDAQALPATVLRPAAFMQNDLMLRDALKAGVYPQPIGGVGLAMVDTRDIAEAAAAELLRRERTPHPLPRTTIELVGPDTLTGAAIAAIWASVLGREVRYGGDDLAAYEKQVAGMMPGWQAHDFRVMLRAMQRFGMVPGKDSRRALLAPTAASKRSRSSADNPMRASPQGTGRRSGSPRFSTISTSTHSGRRSSRSSARPLPAWTG
jgi:uncharacterized protein YbjT (DUF2867 family)